MKEPGLDNRTAILTERFSKSGATHSTKVSQSRFLSFARIQH